MTLYSHTENQLTALLQKKSVISLIGSGGKTTLMYSLSHVASCYTKRILCTATTKMYSPYAWQTPYFGVFPKLADALFPQPPFIATTLSSWIVDEHPLYCQDLPHLLPGSQPCTYPSGQGKLTGYHAKEVDLFLKKGCVDTLLVEADGSKGRPLKAHSSYEPVVPQTSTLVIGVVGSSGLYKPLCQNWVWRPEVFAQLSRTLLGSLVTPATLAQVICHRNGLFKGVDDKCKKILFINTCNTPTLSPVLKELVHYIFSSPNCPIQDIYLGSAKKPLEAICLRNA